MSLSLEDVLNVGDTREALAGQPMPVEEFENLHYLLGRRYRDKRKEAAATAPVEEEKEHEKEKEHTNPDSSHATPTTDASGLHLHSIYRSK